MTQTIQTTEGAKTSTEEASQKFVRKIGEKGQQNSVTTEQRVDGNTREQIQTQPMRQKWSNKLIETTSLPSKVRQIRKLQQERSLPNFMQITHKIAIHLAFQLENSLKISTKIKTKTTTKLGRNPTTLVSQPHLSCEFCSKSNLVFRE